MSDQDKPRIPYWHMYVDADGISRFAECAMTELEFKSLTSAPQWQHEKETGKFSVSFTVLPIGWFGDWHESPKAQWVIPLSGSWFIETMDGRRVTFGPGGIHLGEDIGCTTIEGKTGHLSGVVGDEPCVQMIVQYETPPVRNQPCRIR